MRSADAGKMSIPLTANSASGKTSVCIGAIVRVRARSRTAASGAAWATKAPPGSAIRSAISSTEARASASSTPQIA